MKLSEIRAACACFALRASYGGDMDTDYLEHYGHMVARAALPALLEAVEVALQFRNPLPEALRNALASAGIEVDE